MPTHLMHFPCSQSADGKISIYQSDLYKFSRYILYFLILDDKTSHETHLNASLSFWSLFIYSAVGGKFGGIWDRGALVAINPCDRQK